MTKHSLPMIDPAHREFGFARTVCDCADCTRNCRFIPGYLIPADLSRIALHLAPGQDHFDWSRQHLLASPGAKVLRGDRIFRIPTLVPTRQADGACRFLTADNRCAIHAVAPFGCAFFDAHQSMSESDRRSKPCCDATRCHGCLMRCDACDEPCCARCLEACAGSGNECCRNCTISCSRCGATVDRDDCNATSLCTSSAVRNWFFLAPSGGI